MLDDTRFGDFNFIASTNQLHKGIKSVHLNFKEAEIMKLFLSKPEVIISKEEIITKVWGYESDAGSNNVEAYIFFCAESFNLLILIQK